MKIVTWNINSIRLRLPVLKHFVELHQPDIIALQETKVQNLDFPIQSCIDLGYQYVVFNGEKSYNGVAILSKIPIIDTFSLNLYNNDKRHISVKIQNIELHNFYVPAGGDIPDPEISHKFKHKLNYIKLMQQWFNNNRTKIDKIVLVGDLNVAPLVNDVWSSYQLRNVVSHTDIERTQILDNMQHFDWVDVPRIFIPEDQKLYSWWSYRNKDWVKSNRGRRLDHIWTTMPLRSKVVNCQTIKEIRSCSIPSDHVPIIVDINLL